MPFTIRCHALLASERQKCGIEAFPAEGFCRVHQDEYLSLKSAYEQATKEAEALEILLADISFKAANGEGRDPDEVRADRIIVAKYIERLQSAIRGRKEVEERFSLAELMTAAIWACSRRDNSVQVARCEARLAHIGVSERCGVYALPSNRFCAGHHEEFKALKEKLDICTETTAEYRNQVRWGLQYRAGRDPGVELCKFPINHEQLLATVEMYDLFLEEEVDLRGKYERSFLHIPGSGIWWQYLELRKENERLILECLHRRSKVTVLRLKVMLYWWWLATVIFSLLGVDASENDI
ncbi:hypothetical protein V8D89_002797 [Ganoderma adspersum]